MSTKIYRGFRLATDSFAEALRIVEGFRPWVVGEAEKLLDTFLAQKTKEGMDGAAAFDLWQDLRGKAARGIHVPQVDTGFAVALIPAKSGLLGIAYTAHQAWFDAWCAHEGVEEFAYWNNSDAPEGMSDAAWLERKAAWSVLKGTAVCTQGFVIELLAPDGPLPPGWR